MSHISNHIHCDKCWTLTETKLNEIRLFRYGRFFQIADAVTEMCPNCGELYIPKSTLKNAEKQIEKELLITA